eukprot:TRINITY_DN21094_c0_g1_i1.p1 TRINITY_DN21094_c0_g1~~TRINITY_DN21094_c0_g1_i1.p1  ORF type:complete len:524 (-),score=49.60 TRINITY_DN21094_c0_g1_i1:31-1602(-)
MTANTQYTVLIRGGTIVDGTGRAGFVGDVGIVDDKIVAVGKIEPSSSSKTLEIDATGKIVCPGFIDVHVHSENSVLGGRDRFMGVRQGVTTQMLAPDGFGWAPLPLKKCEEGWESTRFIYGDPNSPPNYPDVKTYLDIFTGKLPLNLAPQVPHCAVRLRAMGWVDRAATDDELEIMREATREWMDCGAVGICTGLDYQPVANCDMKELVELCKVVKEYGGVYAAHTRMQILGRKGAWEETIKLCEESGCGVHISHERVDDVTTPLLKEIVDKKLDFTFESYLYPAGMTHLAILFPMKFQPGTPDHMHERLTKPEVREESLKQLEAALQPAAGNQIIGNTKSGRYVGMRLKDAAEQEKKSWAEFAYDLVFEENGDELCVLPWQGTDEEHEQILSDTITHPLVMVASDGIYDVKHTHPRTYGCFAQVLRKWVREQKTVKVEEAVWKMSGFPAKRFGLGGRGEIAEGKAADIVVFDPEVVADTNSFTEPFKTNVGFTNVLVNGVVVVQDDKETGQLPGTMLKMAKK